MTELSVIEIKPEQAPVLYVPNGLEMFLEQIRAEVNEVPDLSTAKGRARVASLSALVSRSKTAIEKPGRDYLRHLKEAVKPAEAELRRFVTACDELRDEVRRPLTEWEAEQERIKAEEEARLAAEALAKQVDSDHEIALLMDREFDRLREEARAEAERQRIAHEEELKRQAAEQARRDAEEVAQREREEAARREEELKAAAERSERERIEAQQRAEREKKEAAERAEREKQEAIAAERRRQEEAEATRQAEAKRIADEEARRAADKEHRRVINHQAKADLVAQGIPDDIAELCVKAIIVGNVRNVSIKY
ncbi:hypothetical protein [Atlantibacter hermannii]|uniref:hypothetical protein n=1 Tax=Atlantibacter hermannii TaxID=565 RepID=UPI0028A9B389|nr:hypothetical protein [Atlantibacter hermannii]